MNSEEIKESLNQARWFIQSADAMVPKLLPILRGRLKLTDCDVFDLIALKRELADFNIQTKKWK